MKKFSAALRTINWDFLSTFASTQESYDHFSETFLSLYNLYFPEYSKFINKNVHSIFPWMTKGLLVSRLKKIYLCKINLKKPSVSSSMEYKNYRNLYAKILKASKKLYYQNQLIKYQSDCKKTWEILRKAINNSKKSVNSIQSIIVNGTSIHDPATMADQFNNFFVNIATKIVEEIHPVTDKLTDPPPLTVPVSSFKFLDEPLTLSEIQSSIDQLKNKATVDSDGISSIFLKKIA